MRQRSLYSAVPLLPMTCTAPRMPTSSRRGRQSSRRCMAPSSRLTRPGRRTFGFLYCTEVATCQQAVPFFGALTKEVGMGYASVAASETAPNYLAQCLVMQSAHVDALFVGGPPADQVARSCAQQGYHPIYPQNVGTWTTRYLPNPNFQGATGPTGDIPWNIRSPQTKVFHAAEDKVLAGALYPYIVSATYAAGLLLQTALAHASSNPTSQDVYTGLYALNGSTLGGFAPAAQICAGEADHCQLLLPRFHQEVALGGALRLKYLLPAVVLTRARLAR